MTAAALVGAGLDDGWCPGHLGGLAGLHDGTLGGGRRPAIVPAERRGAQPPSAAPVRAAVVVEQRARGDEGVVLLLLPLSNLFSKSMSPVFLAGVVLLFFLLAPCLFANIVGLVEPRRFLPAHLLRALVVVVLFLRGLVVGGLPLRGLWSLGRGEGCYRFLFLVVFGSGGGDADFSCR